MSAPRGRTESELLDVSQKVKGEKKLIKSVNLVLLLLLLFV